MEKLFNKQKFIIFVNASNHYGQDRKEIEALIETEKAQFHLFLKLSKKLHLSEAEIEKQTDFYLDKLNELKEQ